MKTSAATSPSAGFTTHLLRFLIKKPALSAYVSSLWLHQTFEFMPELVSSLATGNYANAAKVGGIIVFSPLWFILVVVGEVICLIFNVTPADLKGDPSCASHPFPWLCTVTFICLLSAMYAAFRWLLPLFADGAKPAPLERPVATPR